MYHGHDEGEEYTALDPEATKQRLEFIQDKLDSAESAMLNDNEGKAALFVRDARHAMLDLIEEVDQYES